MTVVDELPSGTKVFYVDIEGIPPKDVEKHIERIKEEMCKSRKSNVDDSEGKVNLRYNPLSITESSTEDYFIPHRGEITVTAHLGNGEGLVIDLSKLNDKQIKRINDILKEGE